MHLLRSQMLEEVTALERGKFFLRTEESDLSDNVSSENGRSFAEYIPFSRPRPQELACVRRHHGDHYGDYRGNHMIWFLGIHDCLSLIGRLAIIIR